MKAHELYHIQPKKNSHNESYKLRTVTMRNNTMNTFDSETRDEVNGILFLHDFWPTPLNFRQHDIFATARVKMSHVGPIAICNTGIPREYKFKHD